MKRLGLISLLASLVTFAVTLFLVQGPHQELRPRKLNPNTPEGMRQAEIAEKIAKQASGKIGEAEAPDEPDQFARFELEIRTKPGRSRPDYPANYRIAELDKAVRRRFGVPLAKFTPAMLQSSAALNWVARGPGNVSGRTRGIVVDPTVPSGNTWFAGSVGGGIWKSTDGGVTWANKTPNLPNLATTTIAIAASNPNILYAGTGEGFFNVDAINGDGIFKSTDHGESWTQLSSTGNSLNFDNVNRIIVDPTNENLVLACANSGFYQSSSATGIFRSTDGGSSWTQVYTDNSGTRVQQLVANPMNFKTLYATLNPGTVLKSTDRGVTWANSSNGIPAGSRVELAIATTDTARLYAAIENGSNSDLYVSTDGGATWSFAQDVDNVNDAWLGSQGWYDNTIVVHPYSADTVFVGGINIWKISMQPGSGTRQVTSAGTTGVSSFLSFVNWGGPYLGGGAGRGTDFYGTTTAPISTSESDYVSVEIRFGPGISQKAHRFVTGSNFIYPYRDYVTVPFQVWDVTNNRQLMASFRDSTVVNGVSLDQPGVFDLIPYDATNLGREYLFVHAMPYNSAAPDTNIAKAGGERYKNIYAMWPILATGATWTPNNLPTSKVSFTYQVAPTRRKNTSMLTNWYANLSNPATPGGFYPYVHADQHNLVIIPKNQATNSFTIVNANDGGMSSSTDGGVNWNQVVTYNTTQFYGADKKPGANEYIGGMQDNGTWQSGPDPNIASPWTNQIGGDGFEVAWHYKNPLWIVGSSQNNAIRRSTDGGQTWIAGTTGLAGTSSFITKVAKTNSDPDLLFTVSGNGVFRSDNFAQDWSQTSITTNWAFNSSFTEIEISKSNPQVVWAGTRMDATGRIFVSRDGGFSFTQTNNYTTKAMGRISGLATHPSADSVAYALFSLAGLPKILKTANYGLTWSDITGFSTSTSSNGFPDVAVYSLLVMPYDPNVMWAGTEIGIFESTNGGSSWAFAANGLPAVAVWEMKIVDDQVVVATHGRGIWSVQLPQLSGYQPPVVVLTPRLNWVAQAPGGAANFNFSLRQRYDSTVVTVNGTPYARITANGTAKDTTLGFAITSAGSVSVSATSYVGGKPYKSSTRSATMTLPKAPQATYSQSFNSATTDFTGSGFSVTTPTGFANGAIHSTHPYATNVNYIYQLTIPIVVASGIANIKYDDIAIVEPGESGSVFPNSDFYDYVVVEGSTDGFNWTPLADGYDARYDAAWLAAFNNRQNGTPSMYRTHVVNLLNKFAAGKQVFIRFHLFSDAGTTAWGWSIDNLEIQTAAATSVSGPVADIPQSFSLQQNYPNPFNPTTTIRFTLPTASNVKLKIFDQLGREVRTLINKSMDAGFHTEILDGKDLSSGVYYYRLEAGTFGQTKKMVLLK